MLSWLLLSFSASTVAAAPQTGCFLKCKDNYMNEMSSEMRDSSVEWSHEMVTPLQNLLLADGRRGLLLRRLNRICRLSETYTRCLHTCDDGPGRQILLQGQRAWTVICGDFRNDTEFRTITVACWALQGTEMARRCAGPAGQLQADAIRLLQGGVTTLTSHLSEFCSSTHNYDRCVTLQNLDFCGPSAARFLMKLTHETSHALIDLLDQTTKLEPLPLECRDWLNQKGMTWQRAKSSLRTLRNGSAVLCIFSIIALINTVVLFLQLY